MSSVDMSCLLARWGELPSLVLGQVYEYLESHDRLNASQTCKHWRSVLFQKRFFLNSKFQLHIENDRQVKFFHLTLYNLTNELIIIFDFINVFHIEKIERILYKVSRCDNLQCLRFQINNVILTPSGDIRKDSLVDIKQLIVEPLKIILNRKQTACKILDLGAIEALTYYGLDILKSLSQPQEINELTLASIKYDPIHYPMFVMENSLLQKCASLQVLSLDYDTLNEELLHTLKVLPLKKFLICVHGLNRHHPGISERAWSEFSANFNNIELIVTLIYAFEAVEVLQRRILRQNMPITHLRVLFCDYLNVDALEWISINNNRTLKSIKWIDSAFKHPDKNIMDSFLNFGLDPFIMMSWRCKNLEEIVIHGYVLDPYNIVGISRLRGRALKHLEVSMIDNASRKANINSFIKEISNLLGQRWKPSNLNNMHPALGFIPVADEIRDEYVFDLIRRDIST